MQFSKMAELDSNFSPLQVFEKIRSENSVLLHSASKNSETGRYSFIAVKPFGVFSAKGEKISFNGKKLKGSPFNELEKLLKKHGLKNKKVPMRDFPLSKGGAIGFFSYDSARFLEKLPCSPKDDLNIPDIYFMFFDTIIAFDNLNKKNFIFSNAKNGIEKIAELKQKIYAKNANAKISENFSEKKATEKLKSNFSKAQYLSAVEKVKKYIVEGDTFQVNLSQRFYAKTGLEPFEVFKKVCEINPSPFMAFLHGKNFSIASASPERLIRNNGGIAETRPIAGTRKRGKNAKEDVVLENELVSNEKENAEHIMLVDLERNDLGKVCGYGSVKVSKELFVEKYSHVMHLVSNVAGKLHKSKSNIELLKAMFPGGTITGCPKIRTMEIIGEIETIARGPYTGSLGYFDFSGKMDFNILIRTLVFAKGKVFINVGGGIVFDSIPEKEYFETMQKGKALFKALRDLK